MKFLPIFLVFLVFFTAYSTLSVVKHLHFLSGYDLAIADQAVWNYSQLSFPIMTTHTFYNTPILADHVEFIYALLAPFYFIYDNVVTLLVLQAFFVTLSAVPVYLLAKKYKLKDSLSLVISISYLMFYGIQFGMWSDVHSLMFALSFLAWFIYFLETKNTKWTFMSFFLAIICKEDIAFLTFFISLVYFYKTREKISLVVIGFSVLYLLLIFFVYFPYFTRDGYRYGNPQKVLSDINPLYLVNTQEKQHAFLYSLGSYGFLPLFSPVYSIAALADLAHYFVLGNRVSSAQGIFQHYRSTLALLLVWPLIVACAKHKALNSRFVVWYILFTTLFFQYYLHLPLSYLTKEWFWQTNSSVESLNRVLLEIPKDSAVVSQNNITPHLTHRKYVYTLWPQVRGDIEKKPCLNNVCYWFKWAGSPEYLIVDTSADWDIRHFLTNREDFIRGIENLEKYNYIKIIKKEGTTTLYKILKNPTI